MRDCLDEDGLQARLWGYPEYNNLEKKVLTTVGDTIP